MKAVILDCLGQTLADQVQTDDEFEHVYLAASYLANKRVPHNQPVAARNAALLILQALRIAITPTMRTDFQAWVTAQQA